MKKSEERDLFFEENAKLFKLLGSPIRLRLIHYISFSPRTVEECSEKLELSIQNTSLHLIQLAKVGVLKVDKIKNYRYYSLSEESIVQVVLDAMKSDCRHIMPAGTVYAGSFEELTVKVNKDKAILIDLRDDVESRYIPVPRSLPFRDSPQKLKTFLQALPEKPLVFFCKGRWCERLSVIVEEAQKHKFNAEALCLTASELKEFGSRIH